MPAAQGQVGEVRVADGATSAGGFRAGRTGEIIASELHGRYFEQCSRGNVFTATNQAVATTTVGLNTTYTGLVVSNPVGSGKLMSILMASLMQSVIQATQIEAYALATGFNAATNVTHTTPVTPQCNLIGSSNAPVGKADVSATLPTAPVYERPLGETGTATSQPGTIIVDLGGSIVLLPGAYALFVTPTQASVNGCWFGFLWEEVPFG